MSHSSTQAKVVSTQTAIVKSQGIIDWIVIVKGDIKLKR